MAKSKKISELDAHVLKATIEVGYNHFAGKIRQWYEDNVGETLSLEEAYFAIGRLVNLGFLKKVDSDFFLAGKPMTDVVSTEKGFRYFRK